MNGHTATVEFVTDKAADLVVAVYTDSDAEEMVASGTAEVSGSGGNDSVSVAIQGEIPEYYTVKAFLLNKNTHEPLSQVYTDSSRTKVMVDLSTAKASDFPEDRVINLDGQDDTNFAVVSDETTLVTYENNAAGKNQVISEDDDALVYVIGNASDEIKNLQSNDILTYEYEPGILLVVRVKDISADGDTVTIYGDDTLKLTDAFDAIKVENEEDGENMSYDSDGADPDITYTGKMYGDPEEGIDFDEEGEEENSGPEVVTNKIAFTFKIGTGMFNADKGKDKKDEGFKEDVGINGTYSFSGTVKVKWYVTDEKQTVTISTDYENVISVEISDAQTRDVRLGKIGGMPIPGVYIGLEPTLKFKAEAKGKLALSRKESVTATYSNENEDVTWTNTEPETKISVKVEGTLYLGIDASPTIRLAGKLVVAKLVLEGGLEGKVTEGIWEDTSGESKHDCEVCFAISANATTKSGFNISLLYGVGKFGKTFGELTRPIWEGYWSASHQKFGKGSCPYKAYRVLIEVDGKPFPGIEIMQGTMEECGAGTAKKLGATGTDGLLASFWAPGRYTVTAVVSGQPYGQYTFNVEESARKVKIVAGSYVEPENGAGTDPGGSETPDPDMPNPDHDVWTLTNGVLTIEKMGVYGQKEDAPWNDYRDEIREVVFAGDLLTIIGKYALEDCMNLTKVTFNYHIAGFYDNAFKGCTSITDVYCLGDNMNQWLRLDAGKGNECITSARIHCQDGTILGYGKCGNDLNWLLSDDGILRITGTGSMAANPEWPKDQIVNVVIGKGVTSISAGAFKGCENLTNVTLPDGLTSIGPAAFQGCKSLTSVTLPEGMKSIETVAFSGCSGMTEIVIPSSVKSIGQQALTKCSSLTNVVLPEGLISIADGAFSECRSLTSITIPESVTTIGEAAFTECSGLTSVTLPKNLTRLEPFTFSGCSNLSNVIIPESITRIEKYVFQKCSNLTDIEIPESVTAIESKAFYMCSSLASVKLPQKLMSIGEMAFGYCSSLTNIVIPESVTKIDNGAFHECSSLANIIIPEGIVGIEIVTFNSCSSLVSVTIPVSVGYIRTSAFEGCDNLEAVYYGGTKSQWNVVEKYSSNDPLYSATIHCTDGDILHEDTSCENSVTTGSADADNGTFSAAFDNVSAGKDYVVIISRAETDPLNPDNLIYINQITAVADGELSVPFHTGASVDEMVYVVACARDDITIDPVQPIDPVNPDAPSGGGSGSSSGGGGAGAAVVGVVAVATVVGVVLLMPVEVSGTVKLADQAALPGAAVQILKNDAVVAETTTDAEGRFTMKVKRGNYTLRVRYVGADGYPVTRTVDFKAPNKNLNVAA